VGELYSINYESAKVRIHDNERKKVGGIPSLSFLIATRVDPGNVDIDFKAEDSLFILLRVMDAAQLPNSSEAERIRVETAQRVSGETDRHWDGEGIMDTKTRMTGRHGGLPAVIDIIAECIKHDAVKAYVSSVFLSCANPLDYNKKMAFMAEYLRMFGGVLLPGEELLSVYELANNVEAVLQNHVRLVNEFRKTLQ